MNLLNHKTIKYPQILKTYFRRSILIVELIYSRGVSLKCVHGRFS
jgi:hypothetical protein